MISALVFLAVVFLFAGGCGLCYKQGQETGYRQGWTAALEEVVRRDTPNL